MAAAYIFIEAERGRGLDIAQKLKKVEEIKTAHAVTGHYDVIAYVEVEDIGKLGDFIVKRIHKIPGVVKTVTNLVIS